jgi:HSP20 family molecular chaperone IbpA
MNQCVVLVLLFLLASQKNLVQGVLPGYSFDNSFLWPRPSWDQTDNVFNWPTNEKPDVITIPVLTKVTEDDNGVSVLLHVPDFNKDNVQLQIHNNELRATGQRPCNLSEMCTRKVFHKNFLLPHNTDKGSARPYMAADKWLIVHFQKVQSEDVGVEESVSEMLPEPCQGCTELDEDGVTIEIEPSQILCSETSESYELYDIGV